MEVKAGREGGEYNERHAICYGENCEKFTTQNFPRQNPFILLATGKVNVNCLSTRNEGVEWSGGVVPPILNLVLNGSEWSAFRPGCFTHWNEP